MLLPRPRPVRPTSADRWRSLAAGLVVLLGAFALLVLGGPARPAGAGVVAVVADPVGPSTTPPDAVPPSRADGPPPTSIRAGPRWLPPVAPPLPVVRRFDDPGRYAAGHRGVDLGLPAGTPVRAPAGGTVRFAGPVAGRPVVSLDVSTTSPRVGPGSAGTEAGLRFSFEPVEPAVARGEAVRPGQVLGRLLPGHPGCPSCAAVLHWGLRRDAGTAGERYLDPLRAGTGVRLLPLDRGG